MSRKEPWKTERREAESAMGYAIRTTDDLARWSESRLVEVMSIAVTVRYLATHEGDEVARVYHRAAMNNLSRRFPTC